MATAAAAAAVTAARAGQGDYCNGEDRGRADMTKLHAENSPDELA
ncbi:hypothetical protein GCM10009544_39190 [Streptomyces stramineus]|uniref:Uncharacterized protein n=1 Tax=Streptomyces stramineus TaxID=173861 RepID=A0ABN1ACV3_9ACTN